MTSTAKQQMIEGALRLLATKGLQATSFSEVLELTGAPRGSIYYHFPEGKDQLITAAMQLAGQRTLDALETTRGKSAVKVTEFFIDQWRQLLLLTQFQAGCSVLAVTVAAETSSLRAEAAAIFERWQEKLTSLLIDAGITDGVARDFAITLISSTEGVVVLARAQQSIEPFEVVAKGLVTSAQNLSSILR